MENVLDICNHPELRAELCDCFKKILIVCIKHNNFGTEENDISSPYVRHEVGS